MNDWKELENKREELQSYSDNKKFSFSKQYRKQLEREIAHLELQTDFGIKWEKYHRELESNMRVQMKLDELRDLSSKWGFCSFEYNTLDKHEYERKFLLEQKMKDLDQQMKSVKYKFNHTLLESVTVKNNGGLHLNRYRYYKFQFEHEKFCGSRWIFDLCWKNDFQVVEYESEKRLVTVLGRKWMDGRQFDWFAHIKMDANAFKPPEFKNSPLNLSNCYIPKHAVDRKNLFHVSKEKAIAELQTLKAHFNDKLEETIKEFKDETQVKLNAQEKAITEANKKIEQMELQNKQLRQALATTVHEDKKQSKQPKRRHNPPKQSEEIWLMPVM
eukprot:TRINITY_DN4633_c0_g1_i2.p1 TRINITY_DN4633_c0_g1~~TRINITY_DN4633_c0_g1_i2.p1  ORF type:complete len:329 (-),score=64.47 TRINITY_DN4633_c0_g1_i2:76-1062(-)